MYCCKPFYNNYIKFLLLFSIYFFLVYLLSHLVENSKNFFFSSPYYVTSLVFCDRILVATFKNKTKKNIYSLILCFYYFVLCFYLFSYLFVGIINFIYYVDVGIRLLLLERNIYLLFNLLGVWMFESYVTLSSAFTRCFHP